MIKLKTRDVARSSFRNYLKKAEECSRSALDGFQQKMWNSSGIMCIHAATSSADALCTYHLGKRYAGERHDGVIELFRSLPVDSEALDKNSMRLSRIISIKNLAEYDDRLLHEDDASRLLKEMQRFLEFIKGCLPK